MDTEDRGKIKYRDIAAQIRSFEGLRFGNITPTDLDAFIDFHDDVFIFVEAKYGDSELPFGQRLALERLCDACWKAGKESFLLIGKHYTQHGDIDFAKLEITELRYEGMKIRMKEQITLYEAIERIRKKYLKKNLELLEDVNKPIVLENR